MKREIHIVARVVLVMLFSASICLQNAIAVRDLFEESEPPERAGFPGLGNLQEKGKALAKEVVEKVNKAYYDISKHAAGFDAVYAVEENGAPLGKVSVSADFSQPRPLSAKFEGQLEEKEMKDLEMRVQTAWWKLFSILPAGELIANKTEEGVLLIDLSPEATFKDVRSTVSQDYRLQGTLWAHADGAETDYLYHSQTIGGKHYVDSMESRTTVAPVTIAIKWLYTYTRVEGIVVIKKLEITKTKTNSETGDKSKRVFVLTLDLGCFALRALGAPETPGTQQTQETPKRPEIGDVRTALNWDQLSRQVLSRWVENNWDIVQYVEKAQSTIDFKFSMVGMTPLTGAIDYSWEDADGDGALTEVELTIQPRQGADYITMTKMTEARQALTSFITGRGLGLFLPRTAKAKRTPEGYLLVLTTEVPTDSPFNVTISNDFRTVRLGTETGQGTVTCTYRHARVRDKWLLTQVTAFTPSAIASSTDQWTLTYNWDQGVPLLASAAVVSTVRSRAGQYQVFYNLAFRNWRIIKRESPLNVVPGS
jgi:hypothetical protein